MGATGYTSGDPDKLSRTGYARGDVVSADGSGDLVAVHVGTDGQTLTADSLAGSGVDWQTGSGGGGGGGTPANTVVTETTYGQAATAGAATSFSRGDHTHGSPPLGTTSATAAAGDDRRFTATPGYYPPEAYGLFTLSGAVEAYSGSGLSNGDFFVMRLWVPAGKIIARVATPLKTGGSYGSGSDNRFVVYDDAGNQVGLSPDDPTLWTAPGWRSGLLAAPIAAQSVGRFVRAGFTIRGMTGGTWAVPAGASNLDNVINGGVGGVTNVRHSYRGGISTPPATIDPTTSANGFGVLIGLAES